MGYRKNKDLVDLIIDNKSLLELNCVILSDFIGF